MNLPPAVSAGKISSTWRVLSNPKGFFDRSVASLGDPFCTTAMNGTIAVTGRPDLVEQIFRADPDTFKVFAKEAITPILGAGSLLMMDGPPHRQKRKRVAPPLHGDRMKAYGEAMRQTAVAAAESRLSGRPFTGLDLGTEISLDVILRTILGADSDDLIADFRRSTRRVLGRALPILFFSPKTQFRFLGFSPMDRLRDAQQQLRIALREELDRRGDTIFHREDILSILARPPEGESKLDFDDLADTIGTLMFAGHETTAVSIAWALYYLHRSPQWLDALRSELDSSDGQPDNLAAMPLLRAVVQETLRLNPIVTEVLRVLDRPFELGGYELPTGHGVAAAACLTHYNEDIFPNANTFNPERFLKQTFTPSQYYPYGGGTRRCVGAAFANHELAIVLGTLVAGYEFESLDQKPVVARRRNITMGPSTGVRLRIKGRRKKCRG